MVKILVWMIRFLWGISNLIQPQVDLKTWAFPFWSVFTNFLLVSFIVSFNTRPLSFFIGEIISQRTFFHTFFLILMLVKHHKIVSSCRFTESFVCSFNYLIFFLLFEFNTKLQWVKEKERLCGKKEWIYGRMKQIACYWHFKLKTIRSYRFFISLKLVNEITANRSSKLTGIGLIYWLESRARF